MLSATFRFFRFSLVILLCTSALEAQFAISSGTPPNAALNTPYSFTFTTYDSETGNYVLTDTSNLGYAQNPRRDRSRFVTARSTIETVSVIHDTRLIQPLGGIR